MVEYLLPLTFVGIYMAVVLAAIMSTVDSLLVLASSLSKGIIYSCQGSFSSKLLYNIL